MDDLASLNRFAIAAAQKRMGTVAWGTAALAFSVALAFTANLYAFAAGMLPIGLALIILAALTYASYTPLHEAAHGNIHGGNDRFRWLNEACGYLCAPMIMLPHSSHRLEHLNHHRYTNDPARDPDFHISVLCQSPRYFLIAPWKLLWIHSTYIFRQHWTTNATLADKATYLAEVAFSLGWRAIFLAKAPLIPALIVLLGGYALGAYFTIYWFAYRPHFPYTQTGRYKDTSSLIVPAWLKPFEWIWLGQTLHSIHHAFPRVPFYRYHGLFREIEPAMRAHGGKSVHVFSHADIHPSSNRHPAP